MMPPTSIDGTDITGATIDGQDVQEITVDGQTVFTAGPSNLPVAYSNLVAWYSFDSATYGGSNADDVTAILGGSGDDTAYDGTVNGATYQSSGGATDINAGGNSGAFDYDGSNDEILYGDIPTVNGVSQMSMMCWFKQEGSGFTEVLSTDKTDITTATQHQLFLENDDTFFSKIQGMGRITSNKGFDRNQINHVAMTGNSGTVTRYINGVLDDTSTGGGSTTTTDPGDWKTGVFARDNNHFEGQIDDVRIYNTELTSTQVQNIYDNTKPSGHSPNLS